MAAGVNVPVLVGPVQLRFVQSITISAGYRIERIMGSRFAQATQPSTTTIAIAAVLLGPNRLVEKKELEAVALVSRALAAQSALGISGIPVVSGLTISLDMQVTSLKITQSVAKRDALDVALTLQHVPRSGLSAAIGQVADLALAAATAMVPTAPAPNPIPRSPGGLL
jgi:hypothetical protein